MFQRYKKLQRTQVEVTARMQAIEIENKKMTAANEGIWVEAKDGDKLQAVILLDSYPSLMPTAQDNDEHTKAMAPLGAAKLERILREFLRARK